MKTNVLIAVFTIFINLSPSFVCCADNIKVIGSFAADNKLLYLKKNDIWSLDQLNKNEVVRVTRNKSISAFSLSYDKTKLIIVSKDKIYIQDIKSNFRKIISNIRTDVTPPVISSNNHKIAYINMSKEKYKVSPYVKKKVRHIWIHDLSTNISTDITSNSPYEHTYLKWSPDGTKLSFSTYRDKAWEVYVRDIISGKEKAIAKGIISEWIDNNTLVVLTADNNTIIDFFDVATNSKTKEVIFKDRINPGQLTFAPPNTFFSEDFSDNPDGDIKLLNIQTLEIKTILKDAANPVFGK